MHQPGIMSYVLVPEDAVGRISALSPDLVLQNIPFATIQLKSTARRIPKFTQTVRQQRFSTAHATSQESTHAPCLQQKMADDQSQHVTQIPQAVSIAASVDPSTPAELRQQAVEYLQKVKELSEQTWKVSDVSRSWLRVSAHLVCSGMSHTLPARSRRICREFLGPRRQRKAFERAPSLLLTSRRRHFGEQVRSSNFARDVC